MTILEVALYIFYDDFCAWLPKNDYEFIKTSFDDILMIAKQ